jgi:hypothetical protein
MPAAVATAIAANTLRMPSLIEKMVAPSPR